VNTNEIAAALRARGILAIDIAQPDAAMHLDGEIIVTAGIAVQVGHDCACVSRMHKTSDATCDVEIICGIERVSVSDIVADVQRALAQENFRDRGISHCALDT
jgi:hypothetical protein